MVHDAVAMKKICSQFVSVTLKKVEFSHLNNYGGINFVAKVYIRILVNRIQPFFDSVPCYDLGGAALNKFMCSSKINHQGFLLE